MEVKDYCQKMDAELTVWKVKLYDVISKMDQLPVDSKGKIYEKVNNVLVLMTELDRRIADLRTQSPREWHSQDKKIKDSMAALERRYHRTERAFTCYCTEGSARQ